MNNFGVVAVPPERILLQLVSFLNEKLGLGDRAFLTLWDDTTLSKLPGSENFVAIRPGRFPVWQSVVTGSGRETTGFNAVVSLVCFVQMSGDVETKSPKLLTEQARGIIDFVMKVISAMQFWEPKDDDGNDLLREYGRLTDGGFGFKTVTRTDGTSWSVSATDWDLKFTAKLPAL